MFDQSYFTQNILSSPRAQHLRLELKFDDLLHNLFLSMNSFSHFLTEALIKLLQSFYVISEHLLTRQQCLTQVISQNTYKYLLTNFLSLIKINLSVRKHLNVFSQKKKIGFKLPLLAQLR